MCRYFNAWVGTYQIVLGVLTAPLVFLPIVNGRAQGPVVLSEFPTYLHQASQCFVGINPDLPNPKPGDGLCGPTLYVFFSFIAVNVTFNLIMMVAFKETTSTAAIVASAARVALSAFGFTIAFLAGPAQKGVTIYDFMALVVLLLGLIMYQWSPEVQVEAPPLFIDQWVNSEKDNKATKDSEDE